jgi:putative hemolysin
LPELEEIVEREHEPFQTLAGYIVNRLDRLPVEGETFQAGAFEFEVIDMDRQRIDKVLIRRLPPGTGSGEPEPTGEPG